jgi:hypothetical protein
MRLLGRTRAGCAGGCGLGAGASGRCRPGHRWRGDLVVRELGPGGQQERVAVGGVEARERDCEAGPELGRLQRAERLGDGAVGERVGAAGGAVGPLGTAEVLAEHVRGDAVQPWPRARVAHVVGGAAVEGDPERLRGEVLAGVAGAARAEGVDRRPVAVEHGRERDRVVQRAGDQLGVARGERLAGGHISCPWRCRILQQRPGHRPPSRSLGDVETDWPKPAAEFTGGEGCGPSRCAVSNRIAAFSPRSATGVTVRCLCGGRLGRVSPCRARSSSPAPSRGRSTPRR